MFKANARVSYDKVNILYIIFENLNDFFVCGGCLRICGAEISSPFFHLVVCTPLWDSNPSRSALAVICHNLYGNYTFRRPCHLSSSWGLYSRDRICKTQHKNPHTRSNTCKKNHDCLDIRRILSNVYNRYV